jgi:hypothetical protein
VVAATADKSCPTDLVRRDGARAVGVLRWWSWLHHRQEASLDDSIVEQPFGRERLVVAETIRKEDESVLMLSGGNPGGGEVVMIEIIVHIRSDEMG